MSSVLSDKLRETGFGDVVPEFSGEVIRFQHGQDTDGKVSGWFVGHQFESGGQTYFMARWGSWRDKDAQGVAITHEWKGWETQLTLNQEINEAAEKLVAAQSVAKEEKHAKAALECAQVWGSAKPSGESEYLHKKGLTGLYGCRLDNQGNLLVPFFNTQGEMTTLQKILPSGEKRFFPGGKKRGSAFTMFTPLYPPTHVFICEGASTGMSIWTALEGRHEVVVAGDAGNLRAVAESIRAQSPNIQIVIAADNDSRTPGNPGVSAGEEAATAVQGFINYPVFPEGSALSDWNDYVQEYGVEKARVELSPINLPEKYHETARELPEEDVPMGEERVAAKSATVAAGVLKEALAGAKAKLAEAKKEPQSAKGKAERLVTYKMLEAYKATLVRQDKSLFRYDGKVWKELTPWDCDQIKNQINALCGDKLASKDVNSFYATFFRYVPTVPLDQNGEVRSLFNPNPFCANFLDGTLHINQSPDHHYTTSFEPHKATDYCTNILPYEYKKSIGAKNPELESMIDRLFSGDSDKAEKIRAVGQMLGACLVPFSPHFFMLHGKPKTGKSTLIQLAQKLVSRENLCSVGPHSFNGFNMESMVGKLVNCDTDIAVDRVIPEDTIKKVEDRIMFRIRRKGIADVYGYLPGVHIFGGNGLPKLEGSDSGAHDRRWTFIDFNHVQGGEGHYDKQFWLWVFEQSPGGVLRFALDGLDDLLACRGHYLNPESGKKTVKEWQAEGDIFEQFLEAVRNGEVAPGQVLRLVPEGEITRANLWDSFKNWAEKEGYREVTFRGSHLLYKALRSKGYGEKKIQGVRYFVGIALQDKSTAQV